MEKKVSVNQIVQDMLDYHSTRRDEAMAGMCSTSSETPRFKRQQFELAMFNYEIAHISQRILEEAETVKMTVEAYVKTIYLPSIARVLLDKGEAGLLRKYERDFVRMLFARMVQNDHCRPSHFPYIPYNFKSNNNGNKDS
jgi:hypothetical protein